MEALYTDDQLFIPIISDYGFKATFGNEANTLFLRRALQALIKSVVPIKAVTFDKNTFEGITQEGRSGIIDVACMDEHNNQFIVEMQYGHKPYFVQRMKFYALQKFNVLVRKGEFDYGTLTKIYCVAILANNILPHVAYHTIANLRNEKGELFDTQMTFVTVELDKFTLPESECLTNLQKLIYTMKTIHTVTQPMQFPKFWTEEWLKTAIAELDSRKMTAEERASLEIYIARNAEAVYEKKREKKETEQQVKTEMIVNAFEMGLTVEQSAKLANVPIDFVLSIQQQLSNGS